MKNFSIIAGIFIFVLITVIVLSSDTSANRKKIQFTNQNLVLNNENNDVVSEDIKINLDKSKISNTDIKSTNTNVALNTVDTSSKNVEFSNREFETQNTDWRNDKQDFTPQDTNYDNGLSEYEKQKSRIRAIENSLSHKNLPQPQTTVEKHNNRFLIKNIDWNTWKTRFVNQILEDSMDIHSLDEYGVGTTFYYSFYVTSNGAIRNINVSSMHLKNEDKQRVRDLIKSYEYKDITVFPANTQKKIFKVDSFVMLGPIEKKAKPSDFNENEKVKIQL